MINHRKRVSKSPDRLIGHTLVLDGNFEIEFTNYTKAKEYVDALSEEALLRWIAFVQANRLIGELAPKQCTPEMIDKLAKHRHIKTYMEEAVSELKDDISRCGKGCK